MEQSTYNSLKPLFHPGQHADDQFNDEWADTQMAVDGTTGSICAFAQLKLAHPHLKLIISIGGGGKGSENFASVASDLKKTNTLIRTAKALVTTFVLDGVDGSVLTLPADPG